MPSKTAEWTPQGEIAFTYFKTHADVLPALCIETTLWLVLRNQDRLLWFAYDRTFLGAEIGWKSGSGCVVAVVGSTGRVRVHRTDYPESSLTEQSLVANGLTCSEASILVTTMLQG